MKVVLVALYADVQSIGVRVLSACLKQQGHEVRTIFLCDSGRAAGMPRLTELCQGAGLIGLSFMTDSVFAARRITSALKQNLSAPVIWGGVHPTLVPAECLDYADMVCVGEGENVLPRLVAALETGSKHPAIPGIWFKRDGKVVEGGVAPWVRDLDLLPYADYDSKDDFVTEKGTIIALTDEILRQHIEKAIYILPQGSTFATASSRGCPYRCTYCSNSYFQKLHGPSCGVRRRSMRNVIDELVLAKRRLPYLKSVIFHDDVFVSAKTDELASFGEMYKTRVGLPFSCYTSPRDVTREKLRVLCDAGMARMGMGVQTGSERLLKRYRRPATNQNVIDAARLLREFQPPLMPPLYDLILDCPYENDADRLETLHLLAQLPRPFDVHIFLLALWPGTDLFNQAMQDGIVKGDGDEMYQRSLYDGDVDLSYFNLLIYGYKYRRLFPRWLLRCLASKPVHRLLNSRLLRWTYPTVFGAVRHAARALKRFLA